jgi:hypothetical protein
MAQTTAPDADQQALALIQSSGILNPNTTLDQIIELSGKLSGLQDDAPVERGTQVFVGRFYVFKNENI